MPTVKSSLGEGTQSVLLTVAILESLASKPGPLSISEVAREIDASKSRIFRHLQTLASCDFVVHDEVSGGYEVGTRLLSFCRSMHSRFDLVSVARPILEDLRAQTGHTVIISRIDPTGVHVLTSLSSDSPIVLEVRSGTVLPFERSAQGRVALAFTPGTVRRISGPMAAARARFEADSPRALEQIVEQGWAQAQMREGLLGKGAPVLDTAGKLVATLGLLDTATAMSGSDESDTGHLLAAARRLERELFAPADVTPDDSADRSGS